MWRFRQDKLIITSQYSDLLRPGQSRGSNHGDERDYPYPYGPSMRSYPSGKVLGRGVNQMMLIR